MAKATTVREVRRVVRDLARAEDISLDEALARLAQQYTMVCFMDMWDNDAAEVLVPESFPASGARFAVGKIYV